WNALAHVAQARTAHAELRHFQPRLAYASSKKRIHVTASLHTRELAQHMVPIRTLNDGSLPISGPAHRASQHLRRSNSVRFRRDFCRGSMRARKRGHVPFRSGGPCANSGADRTDLTELDREARRGTPAMILAVSLHRRTNRLPHATRSSAAVSAS